MSKKNKKNGYVETDSIKEIEVLRKENNNLKKRIGKLRKLAINSNVVEDEKIYDIENILDLPKNETNCDICQGTLKQVVILDIAFNVCQKCKNRIKIDKK